MLGHEFIGTVEAVGPGETMKVVVTHDGQAL